LDQGGFSMLTNSQITRIIEGVGFNSI
jgi:hypothetical protein